MKNKNYEKITELMEHIYHHRAGDDWKEPYRFLSMLRDEAEFSSVVDLDVVNKNYEYWYEYERN